nr:nucleotide-binding alpha-beta plait domain-containing protein [Tanacetum cinerariifolium]
MARRVSDYRIRRIADRGNEEDGPDSRARGDRFYHNRRSADRGNEKVDRDLGNIFEIKVLRRRVRDLEIQHEIRQIRELELQREMRKETESRYVVRDDVNEEEEYPSFDSYPQSFEPIYPDIFSEDEPRFEEEEVVNSDYEESPVFDDDQYEAETENIFAQQDIQPKLPTDKILDKPIETPQLQKLDVNDDLVDALNINKLDNSHVV